MIHLSPLLALFALTLAQDPEAQPAQDAQARQAEMEAARKADRALAQDPRTSRAFLTRDWMIGVAGDEVVLRSDLDLLITQSRTLRERYRRGDARERGAVYEEALGQRLETLLRVQAGMDLGFDSEIVEQRVDMLFEDRIQTLGGHRATSMALRDDDLTPEQFRGMLRDQLLASTWYQVRIGRTMGRAGRASVDRHVRPGWLYSAYRSFSRSGSEKEQALVGRRQAMYRLQILRVPVDADSTPADAEALAIELRRMYTADEVDFDFLVRTYGDPASQEKLGRLDPLTARRAAQVAEIWHGPAGLAVADLVESGEIGASTAPLFKDGPAAWMIYRLEAIEPATEALPLSALEVQKNLKEFLLEALDNSREQIAFREVLEASFVYPDEFASFLLQRNVRGK